MCSSILVAASLLIGQASAAQGAELPRQVANWVRQLDDDRLDARQAAEASLIGLGPDILELLPAVDAPVTPEVRERLARIRQQLQVERARRAMDASRVTLEGRMPLSAALQALQQQTGNLFVQYEDFDQQVTARFHDTSFWEAVDQLLDQARLRIDPLFGGGRGLAVVEGSTAPSPCVAYAGLFRFEPTLVTAVRDLRDPDLSTLRVRLLIAWESRTTPICLSQRLSELAAADDAGRSVEVTIPQGTLTASVERELPCVEMELPLALPDPRARRLASLRGTLDVMLPGPLERFEFQDLGRAEQVEQHRAGVTVTLARTRKNDDAQEVHVRVAFADAGTALESYRGWIYRNNAYLVDPEGNQVVCGGQRVTSQEPDAVGMAYLFAPSRPLADYRFVYETPSLIIQRSVDYELKDIDLP